MLIHVNSSDLKSVFKDIKPIFKGSTDAAIMGFNIENHILYITCSDTALTCSYSSSRWHFMTCKIWL